MKILIVDVDKDSAERIAIIIRNWGWYADAAHSMDRAVAMVARSDYDVVLLDVSNADHTDIENAGRLKEAGPAVDLVAMNGRDYYNLGFEANLKKQGVLYYTIKPSEGLLLQRVLEHLLIRFDIRSKSNLA